MADERDSRGKIILKSKFQNILYWIIICGVWGIATVFIIVGFPLWVVDEIFGTYTLTIIDNGILHGPPEYRVFKTWLCGIPITYILRKDM